MLYISIPFQGDEDEHLLYHNALVSLCHLWIMYHQLALEDTRHSQQPTDQIAICHASRGLKGSSRHIHILLTASLAFLCFLIMELGMTFSAFFAEKY